MSKKSKSMVKIKKKLKNLQNETALFPSRQRMILISKQWLAYPIKYKKHVNAKYSFMFHRYSNNRTTYLSLRVSDNCLEGRLTPLGCVLGQMLKIAFFTYFDYYMPWSPNNSVFKALQILIFAVLLIYLFPIIVLFIM